MCEMECVVRSSRERVASKEFSGKEFSGKEFSGKEEWGYQVLAEGGQTPPLCRSAVREDPILT